MNASCVSSMNPAVVEAFTFFFGFFRSVLFFKFQFGSKNKIKNALTKIVVITILNILFTVCEYYLRSLSLGLALLATLLELGGDDGIRLLDELLHGGIRLLLLETLENLRGVRDGRLVGLGVKMCVVVARGHRLGVHHRLLTL